MSVRSARSGLSRPVLLAGFVAITGLVLLAAFGLFARLADSEPVTAGTPDFTEISERLDLQPVPEIYPAEDNWRERAGVEARGANGSNWFVNFLRNLNPFTVIRILLWTIGAAILGVIIYVIWRYGSVIQVGTRGDADTGATGGGTVEAGPALANEEKIATLEAVLAIDDENVAIGALQRLVLETALASINATLRKSETARAVLFRLPRDWRHYAPVAALVRLAERVRFAGETLDRAGLVAAVEAARPVLRDVKGRA
ncbi:hypothetical protein HXX25_09960 [Hyphobacterium sp. CCMP332]|uniref:hypothetical protein n=1 Tax=Hyphobacterium sp. CCMP332 TaxID=2749086 RepID=UPI0016506175|nr:hypothetical protein [Hyphobacterium sp. CCMP332]QNL19617.1 hypothetical protein HXX25_09960 [Hyphobacterium sp. CCMP332]